MLVKYQYVRVDSDPHTGFEIITPEGIGALCADDPSNYGDFHLLDVPDLGVLETLPTQEIAEVRYLSHRYQPRSSPFLSAFGNSFVYLAHDDGWFAKVFFRDSERFYSHFADIPRNRIEQLHRRKLPAFPDDMLSMWVDWARQGLYIDFQDVSKSHEEFTLICT